MYAPSHELENKLRTKVPQSPPQPPMLSEVPSPVPSDDTTTNFHDEVASSPSSLSISISDASSPSSSELSDFSDFSSSSSVNSDLSDPEPPVAKKRRHPWERSWPAAEEIALLEACAAHRERYGLTPSAKDLSAALRWRIQSEHRRSRLQISIHVKELRKRYRATVGRFSRGTVPVTDDDLRIYKLSKLLWQDYTPRIGARKAPTPSVKNVDARDFSQLAALYPCLAKEVEDIDVKFGAGSGLLKMAFGRISDSTAAQLECRVKSLQMEEVEATVELASLRTLVASKILQLK